jgi:hypothetical protein
MGLKNSPINHFKPLMERPPSPLFFSNAKFHFYVKSMSFTSFPTTPRTPNYDFVWVGNNSMFETSCKFDFLVIFEELPDAFMWLKFPRGWRIGCSKSSFTHRILKFHFISKENSHGSTWFNLQCDSLDLTSESWVFLRNFTSFSGLEFWLTN